MFNPTEAVWDRAPDDPVIVIVELPCAAPVVVVTVSVLVPDPATEGGLKLAETPAADRPLNARFTEPLKPPIAVTVTVYVAVPPGATVISAGVAVTEKSGGEVMVRSTAVERFSAPDVPKIMIV